MINKFHISLLPSLDCLEAMVLYGVRQISRPDQLNILADILIDPVLSPFSEGLAHDPPQLGHLFDSNRPSLNKFGLFSQNNVLYFFCVLVDVALLHNFPLHLHSFVSTEAVFVGGSNCLLVLRSICYD